MVNDRTNIMQICYIPILRLYKATHFPYLCRMAGIYIHIPFCKQACHYCDFHFSTSLKYKDELLLAIKNELLLRKDYLQGQSVGSIYLGGGTPSLLSASEVDTLIDTIYGHFPVDPSVEISLEANPDDLTREKVTDLRKSLVNRFSIGVQSFYEEDLRWMNRAHNAQEAEAALKRVQDAGFENITADLIYGYPLLSDEKWLMNIGRMIEFEIPHISAYSMTIEPQTALASFIAKGAQTPMNEGQSAGQFLMLVDEVGTQGYEQYEISNYARNGLYSKHNTNYWKGVPYLGLGPSAHSFNGLERQWNVANNYKYIESIEKGEVPAEREVLSRADRFNEYMMTSLRTKWGVDAGYLNQYFEAEFNGEIKEALERNIASGKITVDGGIYTLSLEGKLLADQIASELFLVQE